MASVKYTRLTSEGDDEDRIKFDFSSAFTYEDKARARENYKSVFTYGNKCESQSSSVAKYNSLEVNQGSSDRFTWLLVYFGYMIIYIMAFPLMVWFSIKRVKEGEQMVVFRLGHMQKAKGPGLALVFPFLDHYFKKDVSLRAFSVPPKQVITGDKAIIEVGAEIYFQIVNVEKSVTNVQDLDRSTRVLVQTALCNLLAQRDLADIESERRTVADTLMEKSNVTCMTWGVQITRAELSQIKVLQKPLPKKAPSVMMPPGLFQSFGVTGSSNSASGDVDAETSSLPSALAQLATSLVHDQGANQTEAITQALHAMVTPHLSTTQHADVASGSGAEASTPVPDSSNSLQTPVALQTSTAGMSPEQIVTMIRGALSEEVVSKVQETFQVEISGAGAGTYFLDLRNGQGALLEGPDPNGDPSATLTLTFDDLQAMLQGQLKPYQAYMSGRLCVAGDTAAALKLDELANRVQSQLAGITTG
ncbi:stomatin-like 1 [Plakobranchus ocellatus]|uniref:Stomatin-like 1 n=1 Tax=Plakobranchus ocellatus TaxID=259542 RepID=A0AAV4DF09_9GAST|nr:stomatin-like 1 [Plakobranchus ocellatus]